jgi:hypothetical protein
MTAIAAFVTAHGFGHAARACAVLDAIGRRLPDLRVELFTEAPRWFFSSSLRVGFRWHDVRCDVGLVQRSAFDVDLEATVDAVDRLLPLDETLVTECAEVVRRSGCRVVVADISPLGIAVGRRAGVPAVLVENFTWDWIYRRLRHPPPRLLEHAVRLEAMYSQADLRLRAVPACGDAPGREVPLVWRPPRTSRASVRRRLGIGEERSMVLVSMGGLGGGLDGLCDVERGPSITFVVPGTDGDHRGSDGVIPLARRSDVYHPDLVAAADVVVGKLGYSTVAEVVGAGTPMAYVPRDGFPESPVLEEFVRRSVATDRLDRGRFESGRWLDTVERLCRQGRGRPPAENGSAIIADAIASLIRR